MGEWFENKAFWREMYPYMFDSKRLSQAEDEVNKILALLGFQTGAVLDLCCGPGRHSVALAKKGFQVTGVDKTPFLLEKAEGRARDEGVEVEWILEDMRNFVRPDAYNLVVNMFTSFGYFDNKEDDICVLRNVYQSLRPGGACVFDMIGKEILAKQFQPTFSTQYPDGCTIVYRNEIFDEWSRIRTEWTIFKDGNVSSFKFHHTIYSGQELKERLLHVGFTPVRLCGNFDGEEYGVHASRLIAIGWKTGE